MERRGQAEDRHGRVWYEDLTPEERVRAVEDCLLASLKARGISEIPRLKKVCRIIQSKW